MPTTSRDPRGDNRTKPKTKGGRYGGSAGTGGVGNSLFLDREAATDVVACINAVLSAGDAIMLSRTTNGSVVCITLYSGQDKEKLYAKDASELQELLAAIENTALEAARGEAP